MLEVLREYAVELVGLVNEMSPYLLLGFLFAGILRVTFPRKIISRFMGGRNFRSVLYASLLGVPMPLCSCGVLPAGVGFYRNGASRGSTISFLISTPQTGVDSVLATYALLGLPLAIIRPVVALFTGLTGGVLGNLSGRNGSREGKRSAAGEEVVERSIRELFRYGFVELLQEISKWMVIGTLLAAFLSVLIPDDFFTRDIRNEYLAMALMLLASVPLYICATGSIPIAAVLMLKGLSPGAALVLLMAGPATNVATMAVIGNTLGRKSLLVYLASIVGGAFLFGAVINEWIPREWITGGLNISHEGLPAHGTGWFKWTSSVLLVALMINGAIRKFMDERKNQYRDRTKREQMGQHTYIFKVEGMTCNHCKSTVENGLKTISSVTEVIADPGENQVTIQAEELDDAEIERTVSGLGYQFAGRI